MLSKFFDRSANVQKCNKSHSVLFSANYNSHVPINDPPHRPTVKINTCYAHLDLMLAMIALGDWPRVGAIFDEKMPSFLSPAVLAGRNT